MLIRESPSGPIVGQEFTGTIAGPFAPGAFVHGVATVAGIKAGAYAIPRAQLAPDDFVIVFQHAIAGELHFFVFNIGMAPVNDLQADFLVFQEP